MTGSEYPYRRPPLALIITAQEWVSLAVETLFSPRGYAVLRAHTGAQALSRAGDVRPDLICITKDLQDMRGVDLTRMLREHGVISSSTPIMLIGQSHWEREERLEALRAGVWDVCALPMDGEELFLRLNVWVQAKLAADFAGDQGLLDTATGFYNAQGLLRRMVELGAGAGRTNRPLACVVLSSHDVQATAKPLAQDQGLEGATSTSSSAVSTMATRLRAAGRASDTIGRLSETEFVVVAPDTDSDGVLGLATRLKQALEGGETGEGFLRVKFGCYAVPNFRDASIAPSELLIRAAEALQKADSDLEPIQFFNRAGLSH